MDGKEPTANKSKLQFYANAMLAMQTLKENKKTKYHTTLCPVNAIHASSPPNFAFMPAACEPKHEPLGYCCQKDPSK